MAFKLIPIVSKPDLYQLSIRLNGILLKLTYRYNSRNDTWYKDISDINNNVLLRGIPCLSNIVKMTSVYQVLPNDLLGDFLYFDISGNNLDVSHDDLGDQIKVYYVDNLPPLPSYIV